MRAPTADPAQRGRLEEIRDNLHARIAEAEREGWLGEVEGLEVSLAGAEDKIAQIDATLNRRAAVPLGMPSFTDLTGRSVSPAPEGHRSDHPGPSPARPTRCAPGARGIHPLEAGTGLLIDCGSWLHRDRLHQPVHHRPAPASATASPCSPATDWEAAVTALHAGELPSSGGERRMLLLASSIAAGTPVSLNDALPGIDRRNASLVIRAVSQYPPGFQIHIKKRTNDT